MEKKKYLAPEMRMTEFENDEILTTSGTGLPDHTFDDETTGE